LLFSHAVRRAATSRLLRASLYGCIYTARPSTTKFCFVAALSKASPMPVLITFALPLFAVAGTVSSIASAGEHQLKLLILPKGICYEDISSQSDLLTKCPTESASDFASSLNGVF
jgi:hypothetical protein